MSLKNKFIKRIDEEFLHTNEVMWNNEIDANMLVAKAMIGSSIVLTIAWILNIVGVFSISKSLMNSVMIQGTLELLIPAFLCIYLKGKKRWLKILMLCELTFALARIEAALCYNVFLAILIPTILSTRYYSKTLTVSIAVITVIVFGIADWYAMTTMSGLLDLNNLMLPSGTIIKYENSLEAAIRNTGVLTGDLVWKEYLIYSLLPRLMLFALSALICSTIADKGKKMIYSQDEQSRKTERISTELNLASDIQANMLPNIFPAFPERKEFDVYAIMTPAKEVGGDFYDFYMLDDNHICFTVADVSGKGVPAAMFMVIAKTLIKDHMLLGLQPEEVFTRVNDMLCDGNDAGLFVTAWLGVVDIRTGEMTYVNAGHNPPVIMKNGMVSYLHSKPAFVLAGMEGVKYKQNTMTLDKGDKIFVYTDGVTESTNINNELYGEDRLLKCLDSVKNTSVVEIIHTVDGELYDFKGEADQFDDITMLAFDYSNKNLGLNMVEKTLDARVDTLDEVISFIEEELDKHYCNIQHVMAITVAVEEIYVNIAHYAYNDMGGQATVGLKFADDYVDIYFIDNGPEFNPLAKEDPDISLSAEDRNIGGLGIYMVKKSMNDCWYERKNNQNIFTMRKVIK